MAASPRRSGFETGQELMTEKWQNKKNKTCVGCTVIMGCSVREYGDMLGAAFEVKDGV